MKNGGGHFAPELGGHFELESGGHFKLELGGHFKLELGGQYDWNLHDENQKIKYSIDSLGVRASINGRKYDLPTKKYYFKYDKKGNVIFDGRYNRMFNEEGLLISIIEFSSDNKDINTKYEYTYDTNNRKVAETFTQVLSHSAKTTKTTRKYFYYDNKGLLKQEKTLDKNDKLISLLNYEYKFN